MDTTVVGKSEPPHGIDVDTIPQALQILIIVHMVQNSFQLEVLVIGQINQKYNTRSSRRDSNSAVPGSKGFPIMLLLSKTFKNLPTTNRDQENDNNEAGGCGVQ